VDHERVQVRDARQRRVRERRRALGLHDLLGGTPEDADVERAGALGQRRDVLSRRRPRRRPRGGSRSDPPRS
jgi:hypothetical protein